MMDRLRSAGFTSLLEPRQLRDCNDGQCGGDRRSGEQRVTLDETEDSHTNGATHPRGRSIGLLVSFLFCPGRRAVVGSVPAQSRVGVSTPSHPVESLRRKSLQIRPHVSELRVPKQSRSQRRNCLSFKLGRLRNSHIVKARYNIHRQTPAAGDTTVPRTAESATAISSAACPSCKHENPEGSKYCNACGLVLQAAPDTMPPSPVRLDP